MITSLLGLIGLILLCAVGLWVLGKFSTELDPTLVKIVRVAVIAVILVACIFFFLNLLGADLPRSFR